MSVKHEVIVQKVLGGSIAGESGILPGDRVLSINSHRLRDTIDFMFYSADNHLDIKINRNGKIITVQIEKNDTALGIEIKPFKIMTCRNNCIFCFVKQLPKGLRKTLYVKDEDYRMSFLFGNYITLTNLSQEDRKRIVQQKLSPLYISVHSTNRTIRNSLLGNTNAPDILKELKFLSDNKLRFNAQIVLCPGINDGKELHQTLGNLYRFYPYVLSIAVVPVGLTAYRKNNIMPVNKEDAEKAIDIIESYRKRFMKKHGNPIVYGSDELYLKAHRPIHSIEEYGDLHQIENGVGMVALFMNQAKKLKISKSLPKKNKFLTFTGISFYPFLKKFLDKLAAKENLSINLVPVENTFFGSTVTVAGLLTGKNVMKSLIDKVEEDTVILIPDVVLNYENRFLDDISLYDIQETLGTSVVKISSTPTGLMKGITEA